MTEVVVPVPKPEVRGEGRVMYRCADCGELMEPDQSVIVADESYHPAHVPENPDGR